MPEPGVIQAHLDELRAAPRVGSRYRDRVVGETEDHLHEAGRGPGRRGHARRRRGGGRSRPDPTGGRGDRLKRLSGPA